MTPAMFPEAIKHTIIATRFEHLRARPWNRHGQMEVHNSLSSGYKGANEPGVPTFPNIAYLMGSHYELLRVSQPSTRLSHEV